MNSGSFLFDRAKAIETILYLSPRVSDSDIYNICKLLYFADMTSLERYGRFIFGDAYCAMKQGATPSRAYDLLNDAKRGMVEGLEVAGYKVIPQREADLDYLSDSDVECLEETIASWGNVHWSVRWEKAHDRAWKEAWERRGDKGSVPISVESIAAQFDDSDDLIEYLSDADDE